MRLNYYATICFWFLKLVSAKFLYTVRDKPLNQFQNFRLQTIKNLFLCIIALVVCFLFLELHDLLLCWLNNEENDQVYMLYELRQF